MRTIALFASLAFAAGALAQDAAPPAEAAAAKPLLSSERDYTDPSDRDAPITCKPNDFERQAGKTMGQLFGAEWPVAPAPTTAAPTPAKVIELGKVVWPRGLESQNAFVLVAVLVGVDGRPLKAEPLCASATGFEMTSRRIVMGGKYEPATVDGKPVVAPTAVLVKFQRARRTGAARAGGSGDRDD
jgi:hypothetical protein